MPAKQLAACIMAGEACMACLHVLAKISAHSHPATSALWPWHSSVPCPNLLAKYSKGHVS